MHAVSKQTVEVLRVDFKNIKRLKLSNGDHLEVQRFACVGPKDRIRLPSGSTRKTYVECSNGLAQLRPIYRAIDTFDIGAEPVKVMFKEILTEAEYEGYQRLSDFHYRGAALHGRHSPIIAVVDDPLLPLVIGYVELTTSFIMSKPRARILDAPFSDGKAIDWKHWDLQAMRTKTNLVVRIARCVVYPELRGLGFSQLLLHHAFRYAARHWQVGRLKPYFVEITADMLKYLPFAERGGMHFIGHTEGNLKRIGKDMRYILNNYSRVEGGEILDEDSAGIVDLQVSYATKLKHIVDNGGPQLESVLRLLKFDGGKVNAKQYGLLHGVLRLPKPTYLKGLTLAAEQFVIRRIEELEIANDLPSVSISISPLDGPIVLSDVSISTRSRVYQTSKSRAVQEAFGIKPEQLSSRVVSNLSLEIGPKETCLIVGPSGSGKTLLLEAITKKLVGVRQQPGGRVKLDGKVNLPPAVKIGALTEIDNTKPLIECYGGKDIRRAIYLLNMAGLAEAYLYLRRYQDLSAGQQYRAMIAKMVDSESNLWVADEFCSTLDPITAYIVAQNLRRMADKYGATLIVAAPHWDYFVKALKPDKVVYLMPGAEHRVFDGGAFTRLVQPNGNHKK